MSKAGLISKLTTDFGTNQATPAAAATQIGGDIWDETVGADSEVSRVRATYAGSGAIPNTTATILPCNVETYDNLGEYNTSTYTFTSTQAGYYHIQASMLFANAAWVAGETLSLYIVKGGVQYDALDLKEIQANGTFFMGLNGSDYSYMSAGQTIAIYVYHTSAAKTFYNNALYNRIVIHRIS